MVSKLAMAVSAVLGPSAGTRPSVAIDSRTLSKDARYSARSPSR
ncbi:Uncharacterised protein [Mycobacterium tuberculosis]|nr:Uncharacterised protein [Mycobacterium tuberculosis]